MKQWRQVEQSSDMATKRNDSLPPRWHSHPRHWWHPADSKGFLLQAIAAAGAHEAPLPKPEWEANLSWISENFCTAMHKHLCRTFGKLFSDVCWLIQDLRISGRALGLFVSTQRNAPVSFKCDEFVSWRFLRERGSWKQDILLLFFAICILWILLHVVSTEWDVLTTGAIFYRKTCPAFCVWHFVEGKSECTHKMLTCRLVIL